MEKHEVINAILANGYWLDKADEYDQLIFKKITNDCMTTICLAGKSFYLLRAQIDEKEKPLRTIQEFTASIENVEIDGRACINHVYESIAL